MQLYSGTCLLVMHGYHFLEPDTDTDTSE